MHRGEVWWANLQPPMGRRPVVLLTRNPAYVFRNAVTVAPVTRTVRGIPVEVKLGPEDGLNKNSAVILDNVTTIPKSLLSHQITTLSEARMQSINSALKYALALD